MSDCGALLRAILEHPAEDTPRLMYADYLEDVSGGNDRKRAEFIRVQVEVSRLHVCNCAPGLFVAPECPVCRSVEPLWYKRSALISDIYDQFRPAVPYSWAVLMGEAHDCDTPASFVSRGFVSEIRLPLAAFMQHAEALFRTHPIERVALTDRRPRQWGNTAIWDWDTRYFTVEQCAGDVDSLPHQLTTSAERGLGSVMFTEIKAAHEWLSARCVAYGRSLAGLAPLPHVGNHTP